MSENCKHEKYTGTSKMVIVKMPELKTWQLIMKMTAYCTQCQKPFTFRARHGFSTIEPTVSNDGLELRVPVDYPEKEEVEDDSQPPPDGFIH